MNELIPHLPSLSENALADTRKKALLSASRRWARFHIALSDKDAEMLCRQTEKALLDTGRIELQKSALPALADAFIGSPYINQQNFSETLCALLPLFYALKNEAGDHFPDDELLQALRTVFDRDAGGSVDFLCGLSLRALLDLSSGKEAF